MVAPKFAHTARNGESEPAISVDVPAVDTKFFLAGNYFNRLTNCKISIFLFGSLGGSSAFTGIVGISREDLCGHSLASSEE